MGVELEDLAIVDPQALPDSISTLNRAFETAMLSWPAGRRSEDGVWWPYWYANVHRSTGFAPYRLKGEPLPEHLLPLFEECRPHYDRLYARAIRAGD